jgi:capsular polysaccharide transport system ATP-binding protein
MIRFENVTKTFRMRGQTKTVARDVSVEFPTGVSVALLGRNGAGKSTFLQMIAGTQAPTSGRITTTGTVSWPIGFAGSFHGELTGAQNTRFVARIYGVDADELVDFVEDFAGLGMHFRLPLRTYSSGMRSRLSFGVSMGMRFETYLIDEVTAVGDAAFRDRSEALFKTRLAGAGAVVVSHGMGQLRALCTAGVVLEDGRLTWHDNIEDAIAHHSRNMEQGP